jgi:hypothetical protein
MQANVDVRMTALKRGQPRDQPADRERRIDLQRKPRPRAGTAQQGSAGRDALEGVAQNWKISAPLVAQFDALRLAHEQLDAKLGLEQLDLVTDRRLRYAQLGGRGLEAAIAGRGLECPQRIQGGQFAVQSRPLSGAWMRITHMR